MTPRPIAPRPRTPGPARPPGFTLIELLVVISIIALLIGILLPALGAARLSTQATVSQARLQQIGLGLFNYAIDNRQVYPMTEHNLDGVTWMQRIAEYIDDAKAFRSPLDNNPGWAAEPPTRETSYAISTYLSPDHPPYWGVNADRVDNPARTITAVEITDEFEEDHFTPMFWGYDSGSPGPWDLVMGNVADMNITHPVDNVTEDYSGDAEENWDPAEALPANIALQRYRGRAPYAFADGHVSMLQFADAFQWPDVTQKPTLDLFDPKSPNK